MGIFAPSAAWSFRPRAIHAGLTKVIARLRPDVLAVEDIFHAANAAAPCPRPRAAFVVLAGADAGLPVSAFPPATVKVQVTGFGRAEKAQVALMVSRILALEEQAAGDATDALAVALCHAHLHSARPAS
jgi:crossover junction endodeoxyribonuclease RuvC